VEPGVTPARNLLNVADTISDYGVALEQFRTLKVSNTSIFFEDVLMGALRRRVDGHIFTEDV